MEFKLKLVKKRHAQNAVKNKAKGMVRVKVRGRKRWIQPKRSAASGEAAPAATQE